MTTNTITINVFRESPLWDTHQQWFKMPAAALQELYLESWECDEFPIDAQTDHIRKQHSEPVVLVY